MSIVSSRRDVLGGKLFGDAGAYERITGRVYFSVSVNNPHNRRIVDLRNAVNLKNGEVEFSADFVAIRPKDARKGNGSLLLGSPQSRAVPHSFAGRWRRLGCWPTMREMRGCCARVSPIVSLGWQWDAAGPGCAAALCADCERKREDHHGFVARRPDAVEARWRRFRLGI